MTESKRQVQLPAVLCPVCSMTASPDELVCSRCSTELLLHDRYGLLRLLGAGGQGRTYLAWDRVSGLEVAVKELSLAFAREWKVVELFQRSAQVLATLDHPAIPRFFDAFQVERAGVTFFYLVVERVAGENLAQLVKRGRRFDEAETNRIARQVLEALQYLHGRHPPVVHRDLKPSNIMLRPDGSVAVIDFDIVRQSAPERTGTTLAMGTAGYAPLEQYRGKAVPASDLYALGATLVTLLAGQEPVELMPPGEQRILFQPHVQVSPRFGQLLERLLEPDVDRRYQTAAEVLADLAAGEADPTSSPPQTPRRWRQLKAILAALGLVMAGILYFQDELRCPTRSDPPAREGSTTARTSPTADHPARPPAPERQAYAYWEASLREVQGEPYKRVRDFGPPPEQPGLPCTIGGWWRWNDTSSTLTPWLTFMLHCSPTPLPRRIGLGLYTWQDPKNHPAIPPTGRLSCELTEAPDPDTIGRTGRDRRYLYWLRCEDPGPPESQRPRLRVATPDGVIEAVGTERGGWKTVLDVNPLARLPLKEEGKMPLFAGNRPDGPGYRAPTVAAGQVSEQTGEEFGGIASGDRCVFRVLPGWQTSYVEQHWQQPVPPRPTCRVELECPNGSWAAWSRSPDGSCAAPWEQEGRPAGAGELTVARNAEQVTLGHGRSRLRVTFGPPPHSLPLYPAPPGTTVPAGWVLVQPGRFEMGVAESYRYDNQLSLSDIKADLAHPVTLTRAFLLSQTEVTQGEWQQRMGHNPSHHQECGERCPVEQVSFWDALAYCNTWSRQEQLTECYTLTDCTGQPGVGLTCRNARFVGPACPGYRLPTEAEWEYAARAGQTEVMYPTSEAVRQAEGCNTPEARALSWFCGNAQAPQPVGGRPPNPWGLHDLLGNVREWVWDRLGLYPAGPVFDPLGPTAGALRVMRGGGYDDPGVRIQATDRTAAGPAYRSHALGFRVARTWSGN